MTAVSYAEAKKILLVEHNTTRHALNTRVKLTCMNDRIAVLYLGWEIVIISRRSNNIRAEVDTIQSIMAEEPICAPANPRADIITATLPQPIAEEIIAEIQSRLHTTVTKWSIRHRYRVGDLFSGVIDAYSCWCCVVDSEGYWRAIMAGEYVEYLSYRRAYSYDSFKEWYERHF